MGRMFKKLFQRKVVEQEVEGPNLIYCMGCGDPITLPDEALAVADCPKCGRIGFRECQLNDFALVDFVGYGGSGAVYLAETALMPNKLFAVKVVDREKNPAAVEELEYEAEVALQFNHHAHSYTVVEYDHADKYAYLVSEFERGGDVESYVKKHGVFNEAQGLSIALDLIDILQTIHREGYLYRDLKPQNILLDSNLNAKLCDYGLCARIGELRNGLKDEDIVGSAHYIPPERLTGEGEDVKSDMYSLGMFMYYLFTGENFYSGNGSQEIAQQHVNNNVGSHLAERMQGVDPKLVSLIERLTRKDRKERLASLAELRSAIKLVMASGNEAILSTQTLLMRMGRGRQSE